MTLSFFAWDGSFVEDANIIEVEAGDICMMTDAHIATVECYGGWWEVYNIDGKLCAYWEDDPSCDEDYKPDDIDSDFGFDPYMGEYTYDC